MAGRIREVDVPEPDFRRVAPLLARGEQPITAAKGFVTIEPDGPADAPGAIYVTTWSVVIEARPTTLDQPRVAVLPVDGIAKAISTRTDRGSTRAVFAALDLQRAGDVVVAAIVLRPRRQGPAITRAITAALKVAQNTPTRPDIHQRLLNAEVTARVLADQAAPAPAAPVATSNHAGTPAPAPAGPTVQIRADAAELADAAAGRYVDRAALVAAIGDLTARAADVVDQLDLTDPTVKAQAVTMADAVNALRATATRWGYEISNRGQITTRP